MNILLAHQRSLCAGFLLALLLAGLAGCATQDTLREVPRRGSTATAISPPRATVGVATDAPTVSSVIEGPTMQALSSTPLTATQLPPVVGAREVCSPLEGIPVEALGEIISNPYQPSRTGKDDGHPALDFAFYNWRGMTDIAGHLVHAILPGRVAALSFNRLPYGNMIVIETAWNDLPEAAQEAIGSGSERSVYALYAHLQEAPTLNLGDRVVCGQPLGSAGQTGRSGAPHLHLEVRAGPADTRFTQMVFYDTQAQEEEIAQYRRWSMSGEFASLDPLQILSTSPGP